MILWYRGGTNAVRVTNHPLIGFKALHEMEPMPHTGWVARNMKLDRPQPKGKLNTTVLLKEYSNKTIPNVTPHCL